MKSATAATPSPERMFVKTKGRSPRMRLRVALHHAEVGADERGEVGLVDDEQVRAGDAGAALARDLLAGRDVDHVDREVRELGAEGRREVVAAALDEDQVELREAPRMRAMAARLIEASSRIAVCGQPPVSTPWMRSAGSAPRRVRIRVLARVDVVGDDASSIARRAGAAELLDERGLARAHRAADADAKRAVGHERNSLVYWVSCAIESDLRGTALPRSSSGPPSRRRGREDRGLERRDHPLAVGLAERHQADARRDQVRGEGVQVARERGLERQAVRRAGDARARPEGGSSRCSRQSPCERVERGRRPGLAHTASSACPCAALSSASSGCRQRSALARAPRSDQPSKLPLAAARVGRASQRRVLPAAAVAQHGLDAGPQARAHRPPGPPRPRLPARASSERADRERRRQPGEQRSGRAQLMAVLVPAYAPPSGWNGATISRRARPGRAACRRSRGRGGCGSAVGQDLGRQVAVADVPGEAREQPRVVGRDLEQRLGRGAHLEPAPVGEASPSPAASAPAWRGRAAAARPGRSRAGAAAGAGRRSRASRCRPPRPGQASGVRHGR